MKTKAYRITALLLIMSMLFSLPAPVVIAQSETVTISSGTEFYEFAKSCTLDVWSQDKTVNLTCDIDLSGKYFTPVPTFGGTFNGNGHTISGVSISQDGSYLGLFRYVQQGGRVTGLTVKGNYAPGGTKSYIGGIAGENSGIIENCSFDGTIHGENITGGIVGKNTSSGKILSCAVSGSISGENSTGGIAGENRGYIADCTNSAEINTSYIEKKNSISDIDADAGAIVESYKTAKEENEDESVLGHTDTGGICGYSSGTVTGCSNTADIGYQHIGYNVGGIAGRQSGYISDCSNTGFIQGRKDVGGIVGQAEPNIVLNISESALEDIRGGLDELHSIAGRLITDADSLGDDAQDSLNSISDYAQTAKGSAEIMLNESTDFVSDNLEEINDEARIIKDTIAELEPIFISFENSTADLSDALGAAIDAIGVLEIYAPDLDAEKDDINTALNDISLAVNDIKKASAAAKRAGRNLDKAIEFESDAKVNSALNDLSSAVKTIITAKRSIKKSLEEIEKILASKPESFESVGINAKKILESIKTVKENTEKSISALQKIGESIDTIILNTEINLSSLDKASSNLEEALDYLGQAMTDMSRGIDEIRFSSDDVYEKLKDYTDDVSEQLNAALDSLSEAFSAVSDAVDDIGTATEKAGKVISDFGSKESIKFVKPSDAFRDAGDELFDSLSGISDGIEGLKNTLSDGKTTLSGNLTALNDQFNVVMNLCFDEIDNLENGTDVSEKFIDVSDEDIENTKQGKIDSCANSGDVSGDRNAGGIAGSLAIEYSKDPEDEIEKPDTFNFTYRSKAILYACVNDGGVTGKKDCVGGIAGLAEIGTVYKCENYGDTESTGGSYVGGIAGKSESSVRKSYVKCEVTGKRYVGGVAGKAENISSCFSIVKIKGDESVGAICGKAEDVSNVSENYYVDKGLGAIDGISYKGCAEPIGYNELKNKAQIPERLISFTITFTADEKTVAVTEIKYGEAVSEIEKPEIPEKDGCFGYWKKIEAETVTEDLEVECEYYPYITTLSSSKKNSSGKLALALAQGQFTDKAKLDISISSAEPPENLEGEYVIYDVSLVGANIQDGDSVELRILNENREKVRVFRLNGESWEQIDSKTRGRYILLCADGAENTFCIQYLNKSISYALIITLSTAAVILLLLIVIFKKLRKKRKKRKAAKKTYEKDINGDKTESDAKEAEQETAKAEK